LHRIEARDFFEPEQRGTALRAVEELAALPTDRALT
jgi:hypothetical protein